MATPPGSPTLSTARRRPRNSTGLACSFHTFTPEFAATVGLSDELLTRMASERRSKVAFVIEALGQKVKLTVVHDDFEPGSTVLELISGGWPAILANLKTLLETGEPLPASDTSRPNPER